MNELREWTFCGAMTNRLSGFGSTTMGTQRTAKSARMTWSAGLLADMRRAGGFGSGKPSNISTGLNGARLALSLKRPDADPAIR